MKKQQLVLVIKSLQSDAAKLKALSQLLDKQYFALTSRDTVSLTHINEQAIAMIESVRTNQNAREKLLHELFGTTGDTAISDFIARLPDQLRQVAHPLAKEIRAFNKLCKAKNERNGVFLSSQKQLLQSIIGGPKIDNYPEHYVKF